MVPQGEGAAWNQVEARAPVPCLLPLLIGRDSASSLLLSVSPLLSGVADVVPPPPRDFSPASSTL